MALKSHFLVGLESFITKHFLDEDVLEQLKPLRTLALYEKPADRLYNKFERLPPQSHYSPAIALKIFEALQDGMDESGACARARIPQDIVKKWIVLGKKGLEPFQSFYLDFEGYIADHEHGTLKAFAAADPIAYAQFILKNSRTLKVKYNTIAPIVMIGSSLQGSASRLAGSMGVNTLTKAERDAKMRALAGLEAQGITVLPSGEK